MSLNIKNPEAHALAERVARLTGETLTEAVTTALRERLERLENSRGFDEDLYRRLKALVAGSRDLWREPYRSAEIGDLLYDEMGLPK
jgi:antitoxin VapB